MTQQQLLQGMCDSYNLDFRCPSLKSTLIYQTLRRPMITLNSKTQLLGYEKELERKSPFMVKYFM